MRRLWKKLPDRDWPTTITLVVLTILTLVLALFDPSCRPRDDPPGWRAIHAK